MQKQQRRISLFTGKPYPKCQNCQRTIYSDGLCWGHYIESSRRSPRKGRLHASHS